MKKYEPLYLDVIRFGGEDVITTSSAQNCECDQEAVFVCGCDNPDYNCVCKGW